MAKKIYGVWIESGNINHKFTNMTLQDANDMMRTARQSKGNHAPLIVRLPDADIELGVIGSYGLLKRRLGLFWLKTWRV